MKDFGPTQDKRSRRVFEFGDFRLDCADQLLLKRGDPVSLTPKAFQILLALVEQHGHVVPKTELLDKVWADTFVEESNVTWNIHSLRRALGETEATKFIVTVPRVGFRFVALVNEIDTTMEDRRRPLRREPVRAEGPSVAVLPFRTLDREPGNEYFGDGLTEEVINALAQLKGLRVAARTSSFAFRGNDTDVRTIGELLGVTAVLDGSVRRSATHVRVTAQLINVADGYHLWSEAFDRKLEDIFKIQEEISRAIAEHMVADLRIPAQPGIAAKHAVGVDTYRSYLMGRYFWNKRNGDGIKKSIECYQECLKAHPDYALAHAGLADSYNALGLYRILPPHIAFAKASWAATRALEIDERLAEPYTALGIVHIWYEWNWQEGEMSFRRSLALNPEYATAHQYYALSLPVMGRLADGIDEMERATELEPLSLGIRATLAWTYYLARDYEKAFNQAQETLELDSGFLLARFYLGLICVQKALFDDAIAHLECVAAGTGGLPITLSALAFAFGASGKRRKARQVVQRLTEISREQYVSSYDFAVACSGLEELDAAFEHLARAAEERGWMNHLNLEPMLDNLRKDPRFFGLLRRIGQK